MSAPIPKEDKYITELLGPMDPPPSEEEAPPRGAIDERSGSEDGPPEIEPMREDENTEMPAAAFENDKIDLASDPATEPVVEPEQPELPLETTTPEPVEAEAEAKPSREEGLRRELVRLRSHVKELELARVPTGVAPPIAHPSAASVAGGVLPSAPAADALPNVPGAQVVVSEDGQQVYLPDEEINRRVAAQVHQAMQPTQQQQVQMAQAQVEQQFVQENPERNTAALKHFQDVDQFLGLKLAELQTRGYQPQSVPELTQTMKQMGVETEFAQFFPETAPMFDELIAAVSSQQPAWRRSILDRIASTPSTSLDEIDTPAPELESVANGPQSLARKGGSRSQAPVADKAEFKALEDGFHKDPVGFAKTKYARYRELGRKLGEAGFESI